MEINNSVAFVTGGASGLGEATVKELVAKGAKVTVVDLSLDRGEKLVEELGDSVIFVKADITDEIEIQEAIDKTIDVFGKLNIVVNCAGTGAPKKVLGNDGPHPLSLFSKIVQINLIGTFNVLRLAAEKMLNNDTNEDGERGVIINTASIAAFDGQIGQASYSASKSGIVGMTLPIAREFAQHGIRIVTIAPGLFKTPLLMTLPEKVLDALGKTVPFPNRLGNSEEYALLVDSIITNPMLNGTTIRLDGAIRMESK